MTWADKLFANTLFVSDVAVSRAFYSKVFEKSPVYDDDNSSVFKFGDLMINLLAEDQAPDLIEPARVGTQDSGSRFQLTISVDDVDAQAERLTALGVPLINGPLDRPWGIRTLLFSDPDGHLWELAK